MSRDQFITLCAFVASTACASVSYGQAGVPRTSQPSPDAEIFLLTLTMNSGMPSVGTPRNITQRDGYDNQPSFTPDGNAVIYTSNRGDGHTDIYRFDLSTQVTAVLRHTQPESEYSSMMAPDGRSVTVIRVEADSTQRIWRLSLSGGTDTPLFPDVKPVGYYAQANDSVWGMFVLGSPPTLQVGVDGTPGMRTVARNIGRSLHRIPGSERISFVQKGGEQWWIMSYDPATHRVDTLVATRPRSEDVAWIDGNTLLAGQGSKLFVWRRGAGDWREVADFSALGLTGITRLAVNPRRDMIALVANFRR